jgi:cell division protein FtsW
VNKKIGNLFKGDKVIWMVFFFLCMISIVEVFSASSNLTYKSQNYMGPIVYHAAMIFVGVIVAVFTLNVPCRYFKLMTPFLLVTTIVLLLWVLIFGEKINDGGRWIKIMGFTFQPSELAKGTMVLITAQILSALQREDGADRRAFKYILCLLVPIAILICVENLSTAVLLVVVIFLMMFIGRVPLRQLGRLVALGVVFLALMVGLVFALGGSDDAKSAELHKTEVVAQDGTVAKADDGSSTNAAAEKSGGKSGGVFHRLTTWRNRFAKHFDKEDVPAEEYNIEENFQVGHANIAIASSGIIGKGPGNSTERDFLPQAFSDFIFAIVIEEMGILGAAFVVFLYIVLLYRAARIATRCENNFPAFLIMGLSLMLVIQASFNMMVAVGLAPVTGQPLPLISKGGTSTIINCVYIGAILSVSRSAKMKKEVKELRS